MQVGTTLSEIESYASDWLPEIIGVSISYGQKHAVESILDRLWEQKRGWTHTPLIVLGNIIPASFPDEFLDRYPGIMVASGEGELTAARLGDYVRGRVELSQVLGLGYRDEKGCMRWTGAVTVTDE